MPANAAVPSAPLNVVAHNVGDGMLSITWDAPVSEGESPITEYIASVTFPDSVDPSYGGPYGLWNGQIIGATDREYTFRDLPFDHGDFIVTVNAINDVEYGYETSSAPAALVRSTVPSAPTQLSVSSTSPNTVTVAWAPPSSDGGFPVSDYMVTLGQDFGTFTSADNRTATFTGVPAGSHTVSVTSFNVNGMSVAATAQVTVADPAVVTPPVVTPPVVTPPVVVPVATAPSAPRTVRVHVRRGGKVAVAFKAPASTHGAAVTRYIVTLAGQEKRVSATTRTVRFGHVTKGTYNAKVYAKNRAGRSKAAPVKAHVSAAKAASAPLTLKRGLRGATIVKLQATLTMPAAARSGLFTTGTRTAVLTWQRKHHKSATGVVNPAMRKSLGL
jgi:titin